MADELRRLLDETPTPEERILRARLILRGLMARLDLLGSSAIIKAENGTLAGALQKEDLPLSRLLQDMLAEISSLASAAGIEFDMPADNQERLLSVDSQLTGLALRQVVYNAVIASDPEKGRVVVRTGSMGDNVGIAIMDRGPAVSPLP